MARQRNLFFSSMEFILGRSFHRRKGFKSNWFRRFFAMMLIGLLVVLVGVVPARSQLATGHLYAQVLSDAQQQMQRGKDEHKKGQYETALAAWQEAEKIYQKMGDQDGVTHSRLYQSQALRALGMYSQACETIISAVPSFNLRPTCNDWDREIDEEKKVSYWSYLIRTIENQVPSQPNKAEILYGLGDILRLTGELEKSEEALRKISSVSEEQRAATALSLGNTLRALGNLERDRQSPPEYDYLPWQYPEREEFSEKENYQQRQIVKKYEKARSYYYQAIEQYEIAAKNETAVQSRAKVNLLSLLLERQESKTNFQNAQILASKLLETFEKDTTKTRLSVYSRINLAKSIAYLNQKSGTTNQKQWEVVFKLLNNSIEMSRELKDKRALSFALGNLGGLYEYCSVTNTKCQESEADPRNKAKQLTQEALEKAQPGEIPDIAYQWQWQLGRLLAQTDRSKATVLYESAIQTLNLVREGLLTINTDVQFSFRDNVEPLYRELIALLIDQGSTDSKAIEKSIQRVGELQLAELSNFLRCRLEAQVKVTGFQDSNAVKIYPIILKNRIAVILERPNSKPVLEFSKSPNAPHTQQEIKQTLGNLQALLNVSSKTSKVVPLLRKVYEWIIEPVEPYLSPGKTLVFALDSNLRNIPMSALVGSKVTKNGVPDYLIKHYPVAIVPRLDVFQPQAQTGRIKVFLGAFGEEQPPFEIKKQKRFFTAIENIREELDEIRKIAQASSGKLEASEPLLNSLFTKKNIEEHLSRNTFSAIHLKTHGDFSFDPAGTFIVAFRELIGGEDIANLLQKARKNRRTPIDLLVLSACSTAEGDNRTVFGLAGIAAKTGVRSAVSTLWAAENYVNTPLMKYFYKALIQPNTTKAQALQEAQIRIIKDGQTAPYLWATYVLVGSWM